MVSLQFGEHIPAMEYLSFGQTIKIPVLGIGTYKIGGRLEPDSRHDKECIEAIKLAISLGMTHIDTAEMYGNGHAEELIAEAVKASRIPRKELFITSKVMPEHLHHDDVLNACKKSLQRLKTEYLDLYLVHHPNPNIAITETMKAMNELVDQGLVRFIGVSNFSVEDLKEAQKFSKHKIVANQIEYSLLARDAGRFTKNMESEIIPYCQQHNILVIAWRPLAYGWLAKAGIFPALDEIAKKYKKTQAQVALNWLISKNIAILVKATKPEHIKENIGAVGWRLSEDDVIALEIGFEKYRRKYYTEVLK